KTEYCDYIKINEKLQSFPTRRSSDLETHPVPRQLLDDETAQGGTDHRRDGPDAAEGALHPWAFPQRVQVADHGGGHGHDRAAAQDRKSTRLNSSHVKMSYAVFCLKKK